MINRTSSWRELLVKEVHAPCMKQFEGGTAILFVLITAMPTLAFH